MSSLANERTALGWQRSGLSMTVIGALLLGHAIDRGEILGVLAAAGAVVGAAWTTINGRRLYVRRVAGDRHAAPRALRTLTLISAGAAIVSAAAVLLGGG
jgi:uncharacterized membrane protein YidH (DUF202 family)